MTASYPRKRPRPVAACVRCGRVHEAAPDMTAICDRPEQGGICGGRITWRANAGDWTECPQCEGSGMASDGSCPRCKGDGWLMGRHR
jgi:DnaJ-class molecular chaperone